MTTIMEINKYNEYASALQNREKGETAQNTRPEDGEALDYRKLLQEKMEEMADNIKNGTIQPKFQIGNEAYTIEEWKKFLKKVDDVQEGITEQIREDIEAAKEKAQMEAARKAVAYRAEAQKAEA